jgi:hypothetical protein
VWVYDCNDPGSSSRYVEFNVNTWDWRYNIFPGANEVWGSPNGRVSCIRNADLFSAMQSTPGGAGVVGASGQSGAGAPIAPLTVCVGANATFSDSRGDRLGFVAGKFRDEIPGARYDYPFLGASAPSGPRFFVPTGLPVVRSVIATGVQPYRYSVFSAAGAAEVDATGTPGSDDKPHVSADVRSVALSTLAAGKQVGSLALYRPVGSQLRVMAADETTLSAGERLSVTSTQEDAGFTVRNDGAAKLYRPVVALYGQAATFTAAPRQVDQGEADTIRVSDWSDLKHSTIELDAAKNGGQPDSVVVLQQGSTRSDRAGASWVLLAIAGVILVAGIVGSIVWSNKRRAA